MPPNPIQVAIGCNDTDYLKAVNIDNLISFRDANDGLNVFLFACVKNCNDRTIALILDRALSFFYKKIENSQEYKNLDVEAVGVIDIDKCGKAGEEFFEFFYRTTKVDGMELNAAALVLRNNNIAAAKIIIARLSLSPVHDEFLPSEKQRKEVFDLIAKKHGSTNQSAYFSSQLPDIKRPPRQFEKERERQLLKQLSTVLFFYIKENGSSGLKEIEILHLRIEDVSHLVISCNGGDDLGNSFKEVLTMGNLHIKLQDDIKVNRDKEGSTRVERYQRIFKSIFPANKEIGYGYSDDNGEDKDDIQNYDNIIGILQDKEISIRCINNYPKVRKEKEVDQNIRAILGAKKSSIIILDNKETTKENGLHAEEYLIDFLKLIISYNKKDNLNKKLYSCIAGKKRPCFTCYATMFNFKDITLNYGKRQGYAWKSAFHLQENNTPSNSKITLLCISGNSSNVTVTKDEKSKSGYDSGSDDDEINNEKYVYKME